ncbi:MAG: undecaprenyl-diphosphate phosphatase [Hyphomicrobiaceae bacterium]
MNTWQSVLLGVVEGLTEFIPVSSTGHLLLIEHFLGIKPDKRVFEILIQLGAVLALLTIYSARLWKLVADLPSDPAARRFVSGIVLAFLPAALAGVLGHKFIKEVLFETPLLICITLITGGVILLMVDRMQLRPTINAADEVGPLTALKIGACQCLALVPGVSRSGATIVGAMLLGLTKRAAAEFSFFLAMPTMAGAFAYDLYKNYGALDTAALHSIAIGFVMAFITGVVVVRYLLEFVSKYGFAPFAWWRLIVGGLGLGAILVAGW